MDGLSQSHFAYKINDIHDILISFHSYSPISNQTVIVAWVLVFEVVDVRVPDLTHSLSSWYNWVDLMSCLGFDPP